VRLLLVLCLAIVSCRADPPLAATARVWRPLVDGLDYRSDSLEGALLHLVRVRLGKLDIDVVDARGPGRDVATAAELVEERRALAGVNGTFFDERNRPLGWLVSDGVEKNPLRDVSWWAALIVRDVGGRRVASIVPTPELLRWPDELRRTVRLAMQVGPRTVVQGAAIKLKPQRASRTAACLVDDTTLILVATELGDVESNDLARFMARAESSGGLGCRDGLMFDGGPSTQLRIATDALKLEVRGGWPVPNALVVRRAPPVSDPSMDTPDAGALDR